MDSTKTAILPAPDALRHVVACIRLAERRGEHGGRGLAIKVSPNGLPGIVFQQNAGRPALENITTQSGRMVRAPTLFLYGPGTEPSVMHYRSGAFTTIQVIFKPHALKPLLGIDASALTNGSADLREFAGGDLGTRLLDASDERERVALLMSFLVDRLRPEHTRDQLVEESLRLIQRDIGSVSVRYLLNALHISERQFERRFIQTVGLSPHLYIRLQRFNEAIRLIKTGRYPRLTDVAHALNFHDQSHFIRDIKEFSGMTPSGISQQANDFLHEQAGYSYV
jgi:AraC-like DNA-binding protein